MATVQFTLYAQRLLGTGKTSEAVAILEEGIKEYPDYATAYALLARAYLQLHDIPTAYEVATSAVARFPYHRGLQLLAEQLEQLLRSETEHRDTEPASADAPSGDEPHSDAIATDTAPDDAEPIGESLPDEIAEPTATTEQAPAAPPAHTDDERTLTAGELVEAAEIEPDVAPIALEHAAAESGATEPPQPPDAAAIEPTDFADSPTVSDDFADSPTVSDTPPAPQTPIEEPSSDAVSPAPSPQQTMRIVETATLDSRAMRMLRASNIRLIPGLEFAPLRIETPHRIEQVATVEFPPLRPIRGSNRRDRRAAAAAVPTTPAELEAELRARAPQPEQPAPQKSSLELLAERLERARIKSPAAIAAQTDTSDETSDEPTVVSETMALIYERQGALDQAIKAYTILARLDPERRPYYEEKIAQLRSRQR
ncbi:MAG: tetratricopeptide repeat protein [Chlorobi bacterium]|nr:tetratricopeptide repeat protein [Chlorobiota bacterium]